MLPLANRRILITRARGQASPLAVALEALGATPILIPTIEVAPPNSYATLDAAIASAAQFDWLLFTSANAVEAFTGRAQTLRIMPEPKCIAAIGPATARAVVEAGMIITLIPPQSVAESLVEALRPQAKGSRMLLVRAAVARDLLPEMLRQAGATVTIAEAYRTLIPRESIAELRALFKEEPPDAITFTSASTAQNLMALLHEAALQLPDGIVLASIGPVTSEAMRGVGLVPAVEAVEASVAALAEALAQHFA